MTQLDQAAARSVLQRIEGKTPEPVATLTIHDHVDADRYPFLRALKDVRLLPAAESLPLGEHQLVVAGEEVPADPPGAVYGIIDPDYGRAYTMIRKLAWEEGYAIGLHGSFTRDLDLIAVPWTEKPCEPEHLVRRILAATGLTSMPSNPGTKPQGRLVWTLLFPGFDDPRFVDLSIMPRANSPAAQQAPAVPPGYALVPVEPTPEMLRAAHSWNGSPLARGCYAAMLAAAPQAPAAPSVRSEGDKPLRRGWKIGGPAALPLDEWSEEDGAVLWWRFPIEEPPYVGNPLCDDWPGYHTHWTPLDLPAAPSEGET